MKRPPPVEVWFGERSARPAIRAMRVGMSPTAPRAAAAVTGSSFVSSKAAPSKATAPSIFRILASSSGVRVAMVSSSCRGG